MNDIAVGVLSDAGPDDVDAIARLLRQVTSRPGPQLTAERVGAVLAEPATTVLVARADGQRRGARTLRNGRDQRTRACG